jgi:hypothetical protein
MLRPSTVRACLILALMTLHLRAASIHAQSPDLTALSARYAANQPGSPTAAEIVGLLQLQERLGTPDSSAANAAFTRQTIWWWAAARGLNAARATEELVDAYREVRGEVPGAFRDLLREALAGLPQPGRRVYLPPPYVPRGPIVQLRAPYLAGRPQFGPNEKNGISRLSSGIVP